MQGFKEDQIGVERYLNLRYDGTDVPVMTAFANDGTADPAKAFEEQYKREFGFTLSVSALFPPGLAAPWQIRSDLCVRKAQSWLFA